MLLLLRWRIPRRHKTKQRPELQTPSPTLPRLRNKLKHGLGFERRTRHRPGCASHASPSFQSMHNLRVICTQALQKSPTTSTYTPALNFPHRRYLHTRRRLLSPLPLVAHRVPQSLSLSQGNLDLSAKVAPSPSQPLSSRRCGLLPRKLFGLLPSPPFILSTHRCPLNQDPPTSSPLLNLPLSWHVNNDHPTFSTKEERLDESSLLSADNAQPKPLTPPSGPGN